MSSKVLLVSILLIIFSCKPEEKQSRLVIPKVSASQTSKMDFSMIDFISVKERELIGLSSNLSYWDKYNFEQLKKPSVDDSIILRLDSSNFKFSYELDTFSFKNFITASNLIKFKGTISNKNSFDVFLKETDCYGMGANVFFKNGYAFQRLYHCDVGKTAISILKANESYHFEVPIKKYGTTEFIEPHITLKLVSKNVDFKNITSFHQITLSAQKQKIPNHLNSIYKEGAN